MLIIHKLFKFVDVSTNICLYTHMLTYMCLYSSQCTRVYVAIYGNMLIVHKLFKLFTYLQIYVYIRIY